MKRPELTQREAALLNALQNLKIWIVVKLEPSMSGSGIVYECLMRDIKQASEAISEATGGNDE